MKPAIERLYFFFAVCANLSVFAAVFGGNASLAAGNTSSALSSGSSDPVLLALNVAIAIATLVLAYPKAPQIFFMLSRLRVLFAMYLLVAISALWSTDPASTFRAGAYLFLYLISAAYLSLRFDQDEVIQLMGYFMTALGLMSIPAQFLLPPDPYQPDSWKGVFLQKNELGIAMAIGIAALVAAKRPWSIFRIASLLTCSGILYLSRSMTSILAAVVAVTAITFLRLHRHLSVIFVTILVGAALAVSVAMPELPDMFSTSTGRDVTLSGRTTIWVLVAQKIREHPILGYGYGAFWSTEADSVNEFLNGFKPGQAHNGYLEICLDLGALGLALCGLVIAGSVIRAVRLNRNDGGKSGDWTLIVIAILLIHNVAESDLMLGHIMWFVFLIACFSCWRAWYQQRFELIDQMDALNTEKSVAA